jgi:site-specific DNA-methyltransferase (adenine-specific)
MRLFLMKLLILDIGLLGTPRAARWGKVCNRLIMVFYIIPKVLTKRSFMKYDIRTKDVGSGYLLKDYGGKKDSLHPFGPLVSDSWVDIHRIKHNKYRDEHPCQLPIHLLERIVLMSTDENDIVFDPFVGTGTSALAAKRLGRRFIGVDIDDKYVNICREK